MIERRTRKVVLRKIKGKNSKSMVAKMYNLFKEEKLNVKSITVDNGLEFQMIEITAKQFNFKVYYCQPYSSFQRDSNKNVNGLIRRWYKKETNFSLINNMPRKLFNFKTSSKMYELYN